MNSSTRKIANVSRRDFIINSAVAGGGLAVSLNFPFAASAQGQALSTGTNHDSINTWMGIWFIPLMANTPKDAVTDTFTRQVNALLKQMVDGNNLKYSALDADVPRA